MKLKTSILIWVMFAGVLPLAILGLGVTAYSEQLYQKEVADQVRVNLENIESEIERRLFYDREVIKSLASSQAMSEYKPVLEKINLSQMHKQHFLRSERLGRFLGAFQSVVPGFRTVRVLNINNNTLIKVTNGKSQIGLIEGIESTPFVEEESSDTTYATRLKDLPRNEVSYLLLPKSRWDWEDLRGPPMLNAVIPLALKGRLLGYLAFTFSGSQIDQILATAPRLYRGTLLIAELNPDDKNRHGIMLFNDSQGMNFSRRDATPISLKVIEGGLLWNKVQAVPQGDYISAGHLYRTFYKEYLPYSSRLVSWVLATRIDLNEVSAPFNRIRMGILLITAIAVVISLFLARFGARHIANPVVKMSASLKQYADGDHKVRVHSEGAEEIQELESAFNYMADNLEKVQRMMLQSAKLASIGQMAAGIGHELNNPLNNIMSLSKLVQKSIPASEKRILQDLKSLREEGQRANEIIRGILNFARQVPPHFAEFEFKPWLYNTVRLVTQGAKNKMIQLSNESEVELDVVLSGDSNQLQQVLVNLLLNAIDASELNSTVRIHSRHRNDELVIEVIDQGCGMDVSVMDKVFDPFFTTKGEGEGTGLGLSISLGIIERHNGKLEIRNNPDKGVTATIYLPIQPESEFDS